MKNVVKLENYYAPGELETALGAFVEKYNNKRHHESLDNLTPADVYFGKGEQILKKRKLIKQLTLKKRKHDYLTQKLLTS